MAASDVDLVEMADSSVACRHCDVLELNVHVVLGFQQLSTVCLARSDLERHNMTLRLVEQLDGNADCRRHRGW